MEEQFEEPRDGYFDAFLLYSEADRKHADAGHVQLSKLNLDVFYEDRCVAWGDDSLDVINHALVSSSVIAIIFSDRFFTEDTRSLKQKLSAALRRFDEKKCDIVGLLVNVSETELTELAPTVTGCTLITFNCCADYELWARKVQERVAEFCSRVKSSTETTKSSDSPVKEFHIPAILREMRGMVSNPNVLTDGLTRLAEASHMGGQVKALMKAEGGFEVIADIFSKYPYHSNVYRKGLGVVAMMCCRCDDNREYAGKCHIPQFVTHAFKAFDSIPDVVQEACACVTNLAGNKQNHQHFLDNNVIHLIADVMATNSSLLLIQRWTCAALFIMCNKSAQGISQFTEKNWLELVLHALRYRVKSDDGRVDKRDSILHQYACNLIRAVGSVGQFAEMLINHGVLQECEQSRQEFLLGTRPFNAATQAIDTLLKRSPDQLPALQIGVCALNGDVAHLQWLLATAKSVLHCVGVQLYTLTALANIAATVREYISRFDGFQYVVEVMTLDRYKYHAEVQQGACQVLARYCYGNDNNRRYAGECEAVESVLDCISRFAYSDGKPRVYQEAFAAITNMCCNIGRNKTIVADHSGIPQIIQAMQQCEHDIDVIRWGVAAISTLCKQNERNRVTCGNTTSMEVLVSSLENRSRDKVTVRWVCQALKEVAVQNASQKRRAVKNLKQAQSLCTDDGQEVSLLIQEALDRLTIK